MGFNNVRQFQVISTGHARIENRAGRHEFLERDRRPQTFLTGGFAMAESLVRPPAAASG